MFLSSGRSAADYDGLKEAFLKHYNLSEADLQNEFCKSRPNKGESPEQYIDKLELLGECWVQLSKAKKPYNDLHNVY